MGRRLHQLSSKKVENARRPGYYADGGNLYLQVSPSRTRSWIFRYRRAGLLTKSGKPKAAELGLGSERDISLAQAREKAAAARRLLAEGIDPREARDAHAAREALQRARSLTFGKCAEAYIAAHRAAWRNPKHAAQWQSTLDTYAGPVIGELAVQDVDTALVMRVLEPIWAKKPETASRLRGRIEHVLDWATVRGYRTGDNPARWRGHLAKLLPSALNRKGRQHHAALPYESIGAFMADLRAEQGTAARALELCILTTTRTAEIIGAEPDEFDVHKGLWTIPAERMKAGKEHRVPLSARAVELVKAQPAGPYLFPGRDDGKPLSNMAMLELLKRMGREELTVHGFRSTFRDWAAECTSYPREVCEMALAHAISDKVEAAYRRGDLFEKRRRLMNEWAAYCATPKRGGGAVVPMRRKA